MTLVQIDTNFHDVIGVLCCKIKLDFFFYKNMKLINSSYKRRFNVIMCLFHQTAVPHFLKQMTKACEGYEDYKKQKEKEGSS